MLHRFAITLLAILVLSLGVLADEIKGKVKLLNVKKGQLVIVVGEKEKEFMVPERAKVTDNDGKELPGRLKALRAGDEVTVVTGKDGDKEVVQEVKRK
ncbi:MAG: hypothetical protein K2R98_03660 [Gemmataceae bacterium]|nr:hypothetical protein [Gemmataceae bacterium]